MSFCRETLASSYGEPTLLLAGLPSCPGELLSRLPRLAVCIPLVTQPRLVAGRLAKLCDCGRLPESETGCCHHIDD